MIVFTEDQVVAKIKKFCDDYKYYADAAIAIGCTKAQLALALSKKQPPCPAILKAIKVQRAALYVDKVEAKYVPEREKVRA